MLFGIDDPQLQPIEVDIRNEGAVADALAGAYGAVNAVSLYLN
jgi:NADH dehydrogenase